MSLSSIPRQAPAGAASILLVLALINLGAYAIRNALFAVYPDLAARYDINYTQIGFLQTVFMVPHAIATLPFGWAGDVYDRRRVISFGLVLSAVGCALGGVGHNYYALIATRACVGLGTAAVVPVANSILAQLYDGPNKASRMAIFNLGLFLGGVVGFGSGTAFGFPLVVFVLAIPVIVLAIILLYMPVPDHKVPAPTVPAYKYLWDFSAHFFTEARGLLRIITLRWVLLSTIFMAFAAGGYNAFLLEYLKKGKGMSDQAATSVLIVALFAALAGIVTGGFVGDRLRKKRKNGRLWVIAAGMTLSMPAAAFAIEVSPGPLLYLAGVLTMFCFSLYHAPMAASVDDLAPPGKQVAAQGLIIGVMHLFGTAPSSWILGFISSRTSLTIAMWVPIGALAVAALCMMLATRTFAADYARSRRAGG
jgi:MFS family permease